MEIKTKNYQAIFNDTDKSVYIIDLTDKSEMSAYNTLKRGYQKMKKEMLLAHSMGDNSTFRMWVNAGDEAYNLRMHTWCGLD